MRQRIGFGVFLALSLGAVAVSAQPGGSPDAVEPLTEVLIGPDGEPQPRPSEVIPTAAEDDAWTSVLESGEVTVGDACMDVRRSLAEAVRTLGPPPADLGTRFTRLAHRAFSCAPDRRPPQFGEVTLMPGDRQTLDGETLAREDAMARFGGDCVGQIPGAPSHWVHIPTAMQVGIEATPETGEDLTLVVDGPSGTFCNDDFSGTDPGLSMTLEPGTYEVYVGQLFDWGYPVRYHLTVTNADLTPLVFGAPPSDGEIAFSPESVSVLRVQAGGERTARSYSGCDGQVPSQPHVRLSVSEQARVTVEAVPADTNPVEDLSLLLVSENDYWCNDDFNGVNPVLSEWLEPGDYDLYVGSLISERAEAEVVISNRDPMLDEDVSLSPMFGAFVLESDPIRLSGVALGLRPASGQFGPSCMGNIAESPSHAIRLNEESDVSFVVNGAEGGDTTLVVAGPSGTFCDDDSNGLNPRIETHLGPGTHYIYVGEYGWTPSGTSYGLVVSPDRSAQIGDIPHSQVVALTAESNPIWGVVDPVDPVEARLTDPTCVGWLEAEPTHTFELSVASAVTVDVMGVDDLTLALVSGDQDWCNDDRDPGDTNPALTLDLTPGTYELYVGKYFATGPGAYAGYISIEPQAVVAAAEPVADDPGFALRVLGEDGAVSTSGAVQTAVGLTSGGGTAAATLGEMCSGYIGTTHSVELEVREAGHYTVEVSSPGDTTLTMVGAGATLCDDDTNGANPVLSATLEEGVYAIYVGSYTPGLRHAYVLRATRE
ncbi:MAG: hypothetical protein KC561_04270 [Myxococcales bacterium]|nr:hypothetical protein [Myxococcales bacterium]